MGHSTVANYLSVVLNPDEYKNEEEPLKTEEEIVFEAETNDKSNDNSIITIIWPEKATTMGINTAPADDNKELDKNPSKN